MILAPTLTLSAGSGAAIVRPTFSRDFAGEKTLNNGTGPAITFTRASDATYFDADGVLRFAPNNHIRNSEAGGSTNGVLGSGGVAPTNWQLTPNSNGVTTEIIGTGTEDGLAYIDIKLSGTPTASSGVQINFESGTQIVAANGQTWTNSAYVTLAGGATTNATIDTVVIGRTAAGAGVSGQQTTAAFTPTSSSLNTQRRTATITFNDATVERVQSRVTVAFTNSNPIDLTLRIAAPQLERGPEATAYNPTTGTAYFGPRFDHDPADGSSKGLLIEEARTNSIRNSQAGGAVVGTPGTLPTNWATNAANGVAREVVAIGTENGLSYVDIRFHGTPTASGAVTFSLESSLLIVAADGQTWTHSAYIKLQAGSFSNATYGLSVQGNTAGGSLVAGQSTNNTTLPTNDPLISQRRSATHTMSSASVERVFPYLSIGYTNGNPIDLTLRIAAPQLEQGAFPTSYIPTTTAAATRAADSAVVTPISSFYNTSEGTIYNEFSVSVLDGANTLRGVSMFTEDGGIQNRFQASFRGTGAHIFAATASNVAEWDITSAGGLITAGANHRLAMGYKMSGDHARSYNGAAVATSSTAGTTPTRERLLLGFNGTAYMNGHIRKIAYWPKRLTNTLLEQLTT